MLRMPPREVMRLCPGQIWALYEAVQQEKAQDRLAHVGDLAAALVACNPWGGSGGSKVLQDHMADLARSAGFEAPGYTEEVIPL